MEDNNSVPSQEIDSQKKKSQEMESQKEKSQEIESPKDKSQEIQSPKEKSQEIESPKDKSQEIQSQKEKSQEIESPKEKSQEIEDNNNISTQELQSPTEKSQEIDEIPSKIETAPGIIKLPGFIDVHVHIRENCDNFKENFDTGTCAALAGGITMVCVMPNTSPPIIDEISLSLFQINAKSLARCDYAIYVAASQIHCPYYCRFAAATAGLKMYLSGTCSITATANKLSSSCCRLIMPNMNSWKAHLENWPKRAPGPIVCHAEQHNIASILLFSYIVNRPIHICHISKKDEIMIIRLAKDRGLKVTCEVCPHHLFLSIDDIERIGENNISVRPKLGTAEDQKALWDNLNYIDVFASDHSAHTQREKNSVTPPSGLPGLETILPLLLTAVNDGRLTMDDIIDKFYKNPKKIFNLPEQRDTYIEVNMNEEWIIPEQPAYSKAQWTPYAGMKVKGKVERVVLRGELAYENGKVLVEPGFGKDVRNNCYKQWRHCMK